VGEKLHVNTDNDCQVECWGALRDDPRPSFQKTTEITQPNKSDLALYESKQLLQLWSVSFSNWSKPKQCSFVEILMIKKPTKFTVLQI